MKLKLEGLLLPALVLAPEEGSFTTGSTTSRPPKDEEAGFRGFPDDEDSFEPILELNFSPFLREAEESCDLTEVAETSTAGEEAEGGGGMPNPEGGQRGSDVRC